MRTCSPAPRRGARRRSSHPSQERKRGLGSMAMGQANQDRALVQRHDEKTRKNEEKRRRIANWSETMQQMVETSFNAEGRRLEHQKELSKRWRVTTRSETVAGEDSRRPMVVTSLVVYWLGFGACRVKNDSSAHAVVHTDSQCCL